MPWLAPVGPNSHKDLAAEKWVQGVGLLLSVLESAGNDLVPLEGGRSVLDAPRDVGLGQLAKLQPEGEILLAVDQSVEAEYSRGGRVTVGEAQGHRHLGADRRNGQRP